MKLSIAWRSDAYETSGAPVEASGLGGAAVVREPTGTPGLACCLVPPVAGVPRFCTPPCGGAVTAGTPFVESALPVPHDLPNGCSPYMVATKAIPNAAPPPPPYHGKR